MQFIAGKVNFCEVYYCFKTIVVLAGAKPRLTRSVASLVLIYAYYWFDLADSADQKASNTDTPIILVVIRCDVTRCHGDIDLLHPVIRRMGTSRWYLQEERGFGGPDGWFGGVPSVFGSAQVAENKRLRLSLLSRRSNYRR